MLPSTVDKRASKWFGHVKRIEEYSMAGWVLITGVSGELVGWMDGVKMNLSSRALTLEAARQRR